MTGARFAGSELRTPRLVLRPLDPALARQIASGQRQPDWAPGFPQEGDLFAASLVGPAEGDDPGGAARVVTGPTPHDRGWGPWAIRTRQGQLIGTVGFHGSPEGGTVEVGYGIESGHRNQGLAGEAVAAVLDWARAAGAVRFVARVDRDNVASQRVLLRLGFGTDGEPGSDEGDQLRLSRAAG
jgi:RimJ/RimL family protein N-acetyltransferase